MNIEALFFFIVLVFITLILLTIPFIPAWIEWEKKTDAEPFNVYFEDKTIVDYIERLFRESIHSNFDSLIEQYKQSNTSYEGKLAPNIEYYITGKTGSIELSPLERVERKTNKIVIFCKSGVLPEGMIFGNKVYASENLNVGEDCTINEARAGGDISLESNVTIQKLLHSDTAIFANQNCKAKAFLRAKDSIHFSGDAQFQYLYANRIEFGEISCQPREKAIDTIAAIIPRMIIEENLQIPKGTEQSTNYVVRGTLIIGDNCKIFGNIKCYKGVSIGANSSIIGSIICEEDIYIDEGCNIQGPIVSNSNIRIDKNCVIGALNTKTSVIAKRIYISRGCLVMGQLLAKIEGIYSFS